MVRRITYSGLVGLAVTLILAAGAFAAASYKMMGLARALFWQNWILTAPFGPHPNLGTADHPIYEGTPVDFIAFFASFPLGVIVYGTVAFFLVLRNRHTPNQHLSTTEQVKSGDGEASGQR
jgi:uncharacterized membrane-anchored protein